MTASPTFGIAPSGTAVAESRGGVVEVGWLVLQPLDDVDFKGVARAREATRELLSEALPQFQWRMPLVRQEHTSGTTAVEPAELLEGAVEHRNLRRWDFAVVVTGSDLSSYYRPVAVAAVSRSLEGVVISTLRLDPRLTNVDADEQQRIAQIAHRVQALVLHALGHEAGLSHAESDSNYMSPLESLEELDAGRSFSAEQIEQLARHYGEVADLRLEEAPATRRLRPSTFYLRSAWLNRREIAAAIWAAHPWEIPYRLSGLTTAAVSTLLVLVMSAEAWDLAVDQSAVLIAAISLASVTLTTAFLLYRQRLLIRRGTARLSEQVVVTNVSTVAIVLTGILTSYTVTFLLGLACGAMFFSPRLVESWTEGTAAGGVAGYLKPAGFGAALAMVIGALGATFDRNHYFRHVTAVDEEI